MKKAMSLLAVLFMMGIFSSYALAHCGFCGVSDGYVCAKDSVASQTPGKCAKCGSDLAKGDIKEVAKYKCPACGALKDAAGTCDGKQLVKTVAYEPAK